jgi:hypothetical protein
MQLLDRDKLLEIYAILVSGRTHEARLMLAKYLKIEEHLSK